MSIFVCFPDRDSERLGYRIHWSTSCQVLQTKSYSFILLNLNNAGLFLIPYHKSTTSTWKWICFLQKYWQKAKFSTQNRTKQWFILEREKNYKYLLNDCRKIQSHHPDPSVWVTTEKGVWHWRTPGWQSANRGSGDLERTGTRHCNQIYRELAELPELCSMQRTTVKVNMNKNRTKCWTRT